MYGLNWWIIYILEGNLSLGPYLFRSIYEEVDHWFLIKSIEKQEQAFDLEKKKKIIFGWKPPPIFWFKCDIGFAWDKIRKQSRASWILRNSEGKVLHGKRSFTDISSKQDAFLESWRWAIESLKSFHFNSIMFASDDQTWLAPFLNHLHGLL